MNNIDEVVKQVGNLGIKHDHSKLRMDLVPIIAVEEVAAVLTMGADKYGDWNWAKGLEWQRVAAALDRHFAAWKQGIDYDDESKRLHMAHVATNAMFLIYFHHYAKQFDNRHKPSVGV